MPDHLENDSRIVPRSGTRNTTTMPAVAGRLINMTRVGEGRYDRLLRLVRRDDVAELTVAACPSAWQSPATRAGRRRRDGSGQESARISSRTASSSAPTSAEVFDPVSTACTFESTALSWPGVTAAQPTYEPFSATYWSKPVGSAMSGRL